MIPSCGMVELRSYFPEVEECYIATKCKNFKNGPFTIADFLDLAEQIGRAISGSCEHLILDEIKIDNIQIINDIIVFNVSPDGNW